MVQRRADRVAFPTSVRAVCLEMEHSVSKIQVDDSIRKLIKIAEDAGWEVRMAGRSKLKWYDTNGKLVTSTPNRAVGHSIDNIRNQLRNSGLDIPNERHPAPKDRRDPAPVEVATIELEEEEITPNQALEVLIDYVNAPQTDPHEVATLKAQVAEQGEKIIADTDRIRRLEKQVMDQAAVLSQVADAFDLPSWEVLPTIAGVMGVTARSRT